MMADRLFRTRLPTITLEAARALKDRHRWWANLVTAHEQGNTGLLGTAWPDVLEAVACAGVVRSLYNIGYGATLSVVTDLTSGVTVIDLAEDRHAFATDAASLDLGVHDDGGH